MIGAAGILAAGFLLITLCWLPWYVVVSSIAAVVAAAWLIGRLLGAQVKQCDAEELTKIRQENAEMQQTSGKASLRR